MILAIWISSFPSPEMQSRSASNSTPDDQQIQYSGTVDEPGDATVGDLLTETEDKDILEDGRSAYSTTGPPSIEEEASSVP